MTREEAIKIVLSATVYTDDEFKALKTLIPELKEDNNKRIRNILIDAFTKKNNSFIDELVDCRLTKGEILAYLKDQKDQILTGWTKEQKDTLSRVIRHLEMDKNCASTLAYAEMVDKDIQFLKSIHPIKSDTWKPNECQMSNLEGLINGEDYNPKVIRELYNNLKKL